MNDLTNEVSGPQKTKRFVGDVDQIHVGDLARGGWLEEGRKFNITFSNSDLYADFHAISRGTGIEVRYRYRGSDAAWDSLHYSVSLDTTSCPIRGVRRWLTCPSSRCGRRCEALYFGGRLLGCRHCHQLAFPSQGQNVRRDRAIRRALAIRIRLGGPLHLLSEHPPRPPGMAQKLYAKLCDELEELEMLI